MDERKNDRVPLGVPIRLRISDIDAFTEEHTSDLSAGGIFVEMDDPPPLGSRVHLEFYLEAVQKSIWATGEVRRSVDGQGAGIEFVDLDTDGKRFIELVVEKYRRFHPDRVVSLCETIRERVNERLQEHREERLLRGDQLEIRMRARDPMEFREENFEDLWNREIFIESATPLPLGTRLRLRVIFDEDNRHLVAECEVTRHGSCPDLEMGHVRPGMILSLTELSLPLEELLVISAR
jgi:hypothetical protein